MLTYNNIKSRKVHACGIKCTNHCFASNKLSLTQSLNPSITGSLPHIIKAVVDEPVLVRNCATYAG